MADSTKTGGTPPFSPAEIKRAEEFVRERFVMEGEDAAQALAIGTARRNAFDAAVAELDKGLEQPSVAWRREYSLMLGLERLMAEDEPKLVDGTVLSAHQVDALSGTLIALLAEAEASRNGNGNGNGNGGAKGEELENGEDAEASDDDPEDELDEELEDDDLEEDEEIDEDDGALDDDEMDAVHAEALEAEQAKLDAERAERDAARAAAIQAEEVEAGEEPVDWEDEPDDEDDEEPPAEAVTIDHNAARRFWFEHATGAGKTVAALGFVEATRTGGVLILTHRRNLVDQFHGELFDRGYKKRVVPAMLSGDKDPNVDGPVSVETYQWFVRNAGKISDAYSIVICDEAHTALGEKTSASIRNWSGPIFIGMTATGALIARHVTDLFPTQTSRFDLAQAARRGVISPLRCIRIAPGVGVRSIANVPLRKGEVDQDFDQEELAALLDQTPVQPGHRLALRGALQGRSRRGLHRGREARLQRGRGFPLRPA